MSLVSSVMVQRALVRRNTSGKDTYGNKKAPAVWQVVQDGMPIYVWVKQLNEVVNLKSAVVEVIEGYVRWDADIKREDEITQIVDRRGRVVQEGPLIVDTVNVAHVGASPSHTVLTLRRHDGT